MYSFVTAVLKKKGSSETWTETDISMMTLNDFFNLFSSGYVVLEHTSLQGEHIVDYREFKTGPYPAPTLGITFSVWLTLLPNVIFPTIEEPKFQTSKVLFSEVYKAGWSVQRAHPISPDTDGFTPAQLTDGLLTKPGVSMDDHGKHFLVTVNGHFHLSFPTDAGIKVRDLTKSYLASNRQDVGIFSFTDVGDVLQIPITPDNLIAVDDVDAYQREFLVKTDMDLSDKVVWASIGGYLIHLPTSISVNNYESGTVYINIDDVDIPRRILESIGKIDLKDLEITREDWSPNLIELKKLRTREVMQKYLTKSQSFIIVIATDNIHAVKEDLHFTGVMGQYQHHERVALPLFNQHGLIQHYAPTKLANDTMGVLVPVDYHRYSLTDTTQWRYDNTIQKDYRQRYSEEVHALEFVHFTATKMVTT